MGHTTLIPVGSCYLPETTVKLLIARPADITYQTSMVEQWVVLHRIEGAPSGEGIASLQHLGAANFDIPAVHVLVLEAHCKIKRE